MNAADDRTERTLRILMLEDDESDALLVQRELRKGGLRCETARAAARADYAAALRRGPLDLILADYALPGFDGLAALAMAQSACPDVPFIFVTGEMGEERAIETLRRGATDYVLKDRLGRLLPAVQRALEVAEERRRRREAEERVRQRTSELEQANAQYQALSRRLVELQEEERRALSRDLHDASGQSIIALKLGLGALKREEAGSEAARARVDELLGLADAVSEDLHRLAVNLRPSSLDRYGLVPGLEQLLNEFRKQTGLQVDFLAEGMEGERLPPELETALYRIVQEATTNCARYAAAAGVSVLLRREGGAVQLIVEDDGRGFDVEEALRRGRLGLLGMRERAQMLGGTLEIESTPGYGTAIYANLPLAGGRGHGEEGHAGPPADTLGREQGQPGPQAATGPASSGRLLVPASLAEAAELARAKALSDALVEITAAITGRGGSGEILRLVLAGSAEALGRDNAHIAERMGDRWEVRYAYRQALDLRSLCDLDAPAFDWVERTRAVLVVNDTSAPGLDDALRLEARHVKSYASMPLLAGDRLLGVLSFVSNNVPANFHPSEVEFLNRLATLVALALENARLRETEAAHREDLAERVEELQTVLDLLPVGIGIANDPSCKAVQANPALAGMLGVPPGANPPPGADAGDGKQAFRADQDGGELAPHELVMRMAAAQGRAVLNRVMEIVRADGTELTLLGSAVPLFDRQGRPRGAVAGFVDLTEQRRAQAAAEVALAEKQAALEALGQSQERYRQLFASINDGFGLLQMIFDEAGEASDYLFLDANPAFERMTGRLRADLVGKTARQVYAHVQGRALAEFGRVALTGEPAYFELLAGDDRRCYEVWAYRPAPGLVAAILADATARKQAEELAGQQKALQEGINRILETALTCGTEEELGRAALAVCERVTGSRFSFLGELDEQGHLGDIAVSEAGWEQCAIKDPAGHGRVVGGQLVRGISRQVLLEGRSLIANDPSSHPGRAGTPAGHLPLSAFLGVPLVSHGRIAGMIGLGNREGGYRAEDQAAAESLSAVIVEALERKRAEERLRRSEERARDLIRYAPAGVYEVDLRTGRFRSVNDALCAMLGYSREELLAMNAADLLDDEGKARFAGRMRRALAGEAVDASAEYRGLRKDGGAIYGVLSTRITYRDGQPDGAFVIAHDVTERRRAEEALRRSEATYRTMAQSFPNGAIYVFDRDLRYLVVEGELLPALGQTSAGLEGKSIWEAWDARTTSILEPRYRQALAGESLHFETFYGEPFGDRMLSADYRPIRDGGRIAAGLLVIQDISGRVAMQQENARARAEAEALASQLEAILNSVPDSLAVYDLEARIVRLNDAGRVMLGFDEVTQGMTVGERAAGVVLPLKPDGSPLEPPEYPAARALRGEVVRGQELILHVPSRHGGPLRVSISAAPIRTVRGAITGCVLTFRDVEALHLANERLRQANDELTRREAVLQDQREELAAQAEELRTQNEDLLGSTQRLRTALDALAESEARLRRSEAIYRGIARYFPGGNVTVLDHDLRYLVAGGEGFPLMGLWPEEMVGKTLREVYDADSAAGPEACYRAGLLGRNERLDFEYRGRSFYVEYRPIRDEGGQVVAVLAVSRDITERLEMEKELRQARDETEQRVQERTAELEAIFASLPDPVFVGNEEGITRCNQAALDLYGCSSVEELRDSVPALMARLEIRDAGTGERIPPEKGPFAMALRGQASACEVICRHLKSGQDIFQRSAASPIVQNGRVTGAVAIITDITGRVRAGQALAAQARQLREQAELLDLAHDAIFVRAWDGTIRYWSQGAAEMYGWTREEAMGRIAHELLRTVFSVPLAEIQAQVQREGRWQGEMLQTRRDGQQLTVASRWALRRDPDGRPAGSLVINTDVSAEKRAGEHVAYLATLLENVNDAIIAYDAGLRITAWNHAAEEQYGWKAGEVMGAFSPDLLGSRLTEAERAEVLRAMAEAGRWQGQVTHVRKDGAPIIVEAASMALRDAGGRIYARVTVNRDVTERVRAERASHERGERLAILHEIDRSVLAARAPAEIAGEAAARIKQVMQASRVTVVLCDFAAGTAEILAEAGATASGHGAGARLPLAGYPMIELVRSGQAAMIEDIAALPEDWPTKAVTLQAGIHSAALVPLVAGGAVIGALTISRGEPGPLPPEALELASQVADSLAIAIQGAQLREQVEAGRQQLQALSRRLVEVQERERRYVADQLYNQVGQVLAAVKLDLELLRRAPQGEPGPAQRLGKTLEILDGLMRELHDLAARLSPVSLDRLGLAATLRQYVEAFGEEQGLAANFAALDMAGVRLPTKVETAFYRIAQEALANVARHASATAVDVLLRYAEDAGVVELLVEDNGCGFDEAAAYRQGALGLVGMREWAESLGGRLALDTCPGRGTTLVVEVPV
jgi:PAS domain S-box-containing protein